MKYGITYTPPVGLSKDQRTCWLREIDDPMLFDSYEETEAHILRVWGPPRSETYVRFDVKIESESKVRAICKKMTERRKGHL